MLEKRIRRVKNLKQDYCKAEGKGSTAPRRVPPPEGKFDNTFFFNSNHFILENPEVFLFFC